MKHFIRFIPALLASASAIPAAAQSDFFSTEKPEQLFTFGVRVGLNASNVTVSDKIFNDWNKNSFGSGFDAGVLMNLNIRDYLAIQPGFFFESRSTNFAYNTTYDVGGTGKEEFSQMGHMRNYFFQVPVVASVRFNVTDDIRWNVDFGPNLQFKLSSDDDKVAVVRQDSPYENPYLEQAKMKFFDFGLKLGTGLTLKNHYFLGVSYIAGLTKAWSTTGMNGHHKGWQFLIGYDF